MFKNSISQQGGKWSKRNFIFLLHQGRKNVSFSSVQECDGKHSHFKGFGPIQKWKVPPFFPLCLVLWPGSCTHATCCFTCSPPAEQQCCPVPKQLLFWDEGRPPRNLNRGAWESGKRKKIWFYHLCSETSWALGRPAPKLLSLSFHCNLCTSIKSWILILCCSFNSYPFNPQPCNTAPHLLFPCKRRKKNPSKSTRLSWWAQYSDSFTWPNVAARLKISWCLHCCHKCGTGMRKPVLVPLLCCHTGWQPVWNHQQRWAWTKYSSVLKEIVHGHTFPPVSSAEGWWPVTKRP